MIYRTEVEINLKKKLRLYGLIVEEVLQKCYGSSQFIVPLANNLQEYGIVAQYTMPSMVEHIGVAKRQNGFG